jgi:hypothetical protein
MEQEKLPGTCFELPVGFRDGVALYDLEENPPGSCCLDRHDGKS